MGTKDDIVRIATDYIQRNGVSGFSYADIARKMNIKKPSIHYYFPVKSDLVHAAFEKYSSDFFETLRQGVDAAHSLREELEVYMRPYRANLEQGYKLCLCSMLALESLGQSASAHDAEEDKKTAKRGTHINATFVPLRAQAENREPAEINTADFQAKNIRWLTERFEHAGYDPEHAQAEAESLFCTVQGAQLIARSAQSLDLFDSVTKRHLDNLTGA